MPTATLSQVIDRPVREVFAGSFRPHDVSRLEPNDQSGSQPAARLQPHVSRVWPGRMARWPSSLKPGSLWMDGRLILRHVPHGFHTLLRLDRVST